MRSLIYCLLVIEVIAAGYWYMTDPNGYQAYQRAFRECCRMQQLYRQAYHTVQHLKDVEHAWRTEPFWYEQYARSHLYMGYPEEHVYILHHE